MKVKSWGRFYSQKTTLKDFLGNFYSYELFEEIIKKKPKKILEIGSGTGIMGILLSHLGYKVISIDNDKDIVKIAKENNKRFNGKVNFEFGDGFNLKFSKNSFDICFSQGLYEHFSNKEIKKITDEQLRVCKGHVIISVPNKNYPERDIGNERLVSTKGWVKLLRKMYPTKKIWATEYQHMLRKNMPIKTILGLIFNKKVMSLIIIGK